MSLSGDVVTSIVKPAEDGHGIVLRIYNPTDAAAEYRIEPHFPFSGAYTANLLEERLERIEPESNRTLRAHGIETLIFSMKG